MKDSTIFIYSAPSVVAVAIRAFYSAITSEIDRLRHIHGAIKCTNFTPQQIHGFLPQKKWFLFRLLIIKSEEDPYRLYSVFAKGGNCNKERALKKGAREKSDNGNKERKKASKGEFSLGKKATHTHIAFASSEWVMRIMWSAATHSFFFSLIHSSCTIQQPQIQTLFLGLFCSLKIELFSEAEAPSNGCKCFKIHQVCDRRRRSCRQDLYAYLLYQQ